MKVVEGTNELLRDALYHWLGETLIIFEYLKKLSCNIYGHLLRIQHAGKLMKSQSMREREGRVSDNMSGTMGRYDTI
jgi:hypothetical protein